MKRQTQQDRQKIKSELSVAFDCWRRMTDEDLMKEVQRRFPAITGVPEREFLIKFLVMDKLDEIN